MGWCAVNCFMLLPTAGALALQTQQSLQEQVPYRPIDLPQRPMFVFAHIEKSAGSFLDKLFTAALPAENYLGFHNAWDHDKKRVITGDAMMPMPHVPDDYFVVSSVRNPCQAMVSEWSYCCERTWASQNGLPELAKFDCGSALLAADLCPKFSFQDGIIDRKHIQTDDLNVAAFHALLGSRSEMVYERNFNTTLRTIGPDRVNCWVRVENIEETVRECLRQYEELTGSPVYEGALNGEFYSNSGLHGDCQEYFTPDVEQHVRDRNQFVFKYFGYTGCCDSK